MKDTECPYCQSDIEINHDDGYGYDESKAHEQECGNCGNVFVFYTSISFSYDTKKAPCLNGGKHRYKETFTMPRRYTRLRCVYCDNEANISEKRALELENM